MKRSLVALAAFAVLAAALFLAATFHRADETAPFRAKAEAGDPEAENRLGEYYAFSQKDDSRRDLGEAEKWFTKAAEKGSVAAEDNLGHLYALRKDYKTAERWFRRAAGHGDQEAAMSLDTLIQTGYLGDPDYAEAYFWARVAKDEMHLTLLEADLTPDQKAAVEQRLKAWRPEKPSPAPVSAPPASSEPPLLSR